MTALATCTDAAQVCDDSQCFRKNYYHYTYAHACTGLLLLVICLTMVMALTNGMREMTPLIQLLHREAMRPHLHVPFFF